MAKRNVREVIAAARPVTRSAVICLAGDLQAQFEALDRELRAEVAKPHATLADGGQRRDLAQQIEAVQAEMAEHEQAFTFRALSARAWSDLIADHPARPGKDEAFNAETFPDAMLAACSVDPEMTPDDVAALGDVLSNAQYSVLFEAAWSCNAARLDVPFSVLASRVLHESETS